MASIDMIKEEGEPANFLETGGGITKELMANALRLVLKKPDKLLEKYFLETGFNLNE